MTGPTVILTLKILVGLVTVLLCCSLYALYKGHYRLHGRINLVFFVLTLATLLGFEVVIRLIEPKIFEYIQQNELLRQRLLIHLCFAIPSALLMPVMLYTGLKRKTNLHKTLGCIFGALWLGTFITGVFFLPHE